MSKFDVIIIGSGPGGYVAAIRAAQLGFRTAIIEKDDTLGGTCLNVGCIPSKALLDSSEHYHNALHRFENHGIILEKLGVNMPQMIKRKAEVVSENVKGIEFLMRKNKIEVLKGVGSFAGGKRVMVTANTGEVQEYESENIIIATGSRPNTPALFNYDGKRVITSTEALEIKKIPGRMVLIGAGVIGLELGSVFGRLGTEVTVIEYLDRALPGMDKDCARELVRSMKKQLGVQFLLSHEVTGVKGTSRTATVTAKDRKSGEEKTFQADYCLVAIGRVPYTDGLNLEAIGLKTDERGRIEVGPDLQTAVSGVYAIGDVVRGAMLAHKAEEEGVFVAEVIAGQRPHIHYELIPGVVYTWPEVASVGRTEEQLKKAGIAFKVGKFPYKALGRARASMDVEGLVKVLADEQTDEILGVHMVGARAADMIAEAVALMEFRASAEDAARMSHAHPTYTEAMKEAALAATGNRAIHI